MTDYSNGNSYQDFHKTIDGKQFLCKKHKLDYRITCFECQEKHEKLTEVLRRPLYTLVKEAEGELKEAQQNLKTASKYGQSGLPDADDTEEVLKWYRKFVI